MLPEISFREGQIKGKWNRKFFKPDQKDKDGSACKIVKVA